MEKETQDTNRNVKKIKTWDLANQIVSKDHDTTLSNPEGMEHVYYLWERRGAKNQQEFNNFYNALNGAILVDLASGYNPGATVDFAQKHKVKQYIAIDKFNKPLFKKIDTSLKTMSIKEDMLIALASLPDNYAHIALNNFDEHILYPGESRANREYLQSLTAELKRVAGTDHYIFGANSPHLKHLIGDFENILPERKIADPLLKPNEFILRQSNPAPDKK